MSFEFRDGHYCIGVWFASGFMPFGGPFGSKGVQQGDVMMAIFREGPSAEEGKFRYTGQYRFRYYNPASVDPDDGLDRKKWYSMEFEDTSDELVEAKMNGFAQKAFGLVGPVDHVQMMTSDCNAIIERISSRPWCHLSSVEDEKS